MTTIRWWDSHCHLGYEGRSDSAGASEAGEEGSAAAVDGTIAEAQAAGVRRMIDVGTTLGDSRTAAETARRHPGVVNSTAGIHPHDAHTVDDDALAGISQLLSLPEVVAVGETGLDYHYDHSPRAKQRRAFAAHISLANEHRTGLVVHCRDAWDDTIELLRSGPTPERVVLHCFTGGPEEAARCLDLGAHLSFSGLVTFKNADSVRAAARLCPSDRMLVETDSPFLSPVPVRGSTNRPSRAAIVGAYLADLRGVPEEEFADQVWANTTRFFGVGQE